MLTDLLQLHTHSRYFTHGIERLWFFLMTNNKKFSFLVVGQLQSVRIDFISLVGVDFYTHWNVQLQYNTSALQIKRPPKAPYLHNIYCPPNNDAKKKEEEKKKKLQLKCDETRKEKQKDTSRLLTTVPSIFFSFWTHFCVMLHRGIF